MFIKCLNESDGSHVMTVTYFQNMPHKIQVHFKKNGWSPLDVQGFIWMYCLGHAGVRGNDTADRLDSDAAVSAQSLR